MRIRVAAGAALVGVLLVLGAPAHAEEPVDLGASPILDVVGALEDEAAAEAAIDATFERTGVSLFVVLVDDFTSPADPDAWTDATAERNGLGVDDVLLAIATEGRTYSVSADIATLDDAQFEAVLDRVEQSLRESDWDGAVVGAADEIAARLDAEFDPMPLAIGGGVVLAGGAVAAGVALVRRRRATAGARASARELDTRAGSLLVQLDDAVKTSEQELGFAVAQFGDEPTAPFRIALEAAKAQVAEAFAIRQRLDDAHPETAEERRTLTTRIIELCEAADATLDAQADAFDELRRLEQNAPRLVDELTPQQAALEPRIEAAETTLMGLRDRYGLPAVDAIDENPAQARRLVGFAGSALDEAREALAGGEEGRAAVAVRAAQQSLGQVEQLLTAVDDLAADLPELDARLDAAVADTRSDIAEARAADAEALAAAVAEAERVLGQVENQDPTTALAAVEQANAALGRELSAVRDRQAQVTRAEAQLDRVTAEARTAVEQARQYLTTRRGAVGASARTRLAEAEAQLTQALTLGATDAVAALAAAQQSARLAGSALALARSDVTAFDRPASSGSWSGYDDGGGAVLGGILDALFSGSGSSSSGWSGSRRRSSGGFGGSSRRSSGSSSRRSSGGSRRSSGGRRSRGGRF